MNIRIVEKILIALLIAWSLLIMSIVLADEKQTLPDTDIPYRNDMQRLDTYTKEL